jgi:hypothetical protein
VGGVFFLVDNFQDQNPLAKMLIAGEVKDGDSLLIVTEQDKLLFKNN